MTVLGELMAGCAVLAACGGGGSATNPTDTTAVSSATPDTAAARLRWHAPAPTPVPSPAATPAPAPAPTLTPIATPVSARFSATSADFPNPERGFYGWSGNDFVSSYDAGSVQGAYDAGQRLILAKVQLDAFRTTDLSPAFLSTLGARFASLRAAGMKATLLFSYDFSASGQDASAALIKRHLEQLNPVLAANADVIPYMRAGFIGAWGEWHSSASGNSCGYNSGTTSCTTADANRITVRDALLANVPSSTQIGFRLPADLMKWYPSAQAPTRVGMHNDCFMAGPSDTGTYSSTTQRSYIQTLSANGAFGGETCDGEAPSRTNCADILAEGRQYHLAWLNTNFSTTFINAWKAAGCYSQVSASMGYRLQLDGVTHNASATRGSTTTVQVDLRNIGWSRLFSNRVVVVTLRNRTSGASYSGSAGDLSTLPDQATGSSRVTVSVSVPSSAATGAYDVYISAPDAHANSAGDARFAIRFANADNAGLGQAWEAAAGRFKVGTTLMVN